MRLALGSKWIPQCKEDFGEAYVRSVAAAAGCRLENVKRDYDGIDAYCVRYGDDGTIPDAALNVQLKSTHNVRSYVDELSYSLPIGNYNKLRVRRSNAPSILILVVVPADPTDWTEQDEEDLHLFRAGYWANLLGKPAVSNKTHRTVRIPRANLFTVEELDAIMSRVVEDDFP
jgi:hypothetical protein